MTKRPSASARAVREKPVPTWRAVTLALATEAPPGSVILPAMLPRPCACEETATNRRTRRTNKTCFFIFCLPFRGVPERESGPARRMTIECGSPRRNSRAQNPKAELNEELTRRLLWPIVTLSLLNRCIGRDIRSARAVSQSGNLKQCFSQTKSEALASSVLSNMIVEFSVGVRAGYAMMAPANGRIPCHKQSFAAKKYLAGGGRLRFC